MKGFFQQREKKTGNYCYLCKTQKLNKYQFGRGQKGIVNVIGFDERSESFAFLKSKFARQGIDIYEDCLNIMIPYCLKKNTAVCSYALGKILEDFSPRLIMLYGKESVKAFLTGRWKKDLGEIAKWRGWVIPDQDYRCYAAPLYEPAWNFDAKIEFKRLWDGDFERALKSIENMNRRLDKVKKPVIKVLNDLKDLQNIKVDMTAFDYETTGIKPYAKGHKIVCCSIAVSASEVFVFELGRDKEQLKYFRSYLRNKRIGKIAQNMKFEDTWSRVVLKTQVKGWEWDTMLASHILDNREGVTGLKFQTYVQFGIVDYDSDVEPYLKAKDANSINRIEELMKTSEGKNKVLEYCAYDSIYEYRLAMKQMKQMEIMDYSYLPF